MNLFLPNNTSLPRIVFFIISVLWLKFNVSSSYFCWQYNVRILVICDAYTVVARWKETFASEHNLDYTECLLRSLNCIIFRLSLAAFIGFMPNCYYCTIIQFSVLLHNQHFKEFATHQSLPDFGVQVLESFSFFVVVFWWGLLFLGILDVAQSVVLKNSSCSRSQL